MSRGFHKRLKPAAVALRLASTMQTSIVIRRSAPCEPRVLIACFAAGRSLLGEGATGKVWAARFGPGRIEVAAKIVQKDLLSKEQVCDHEMRGMQALVADL